MSAVNIVKWYNRPDYGDGRNYYDVTYWKDDEEGQVRVSGLRLLRVLWILWRLKP